MTTHEPIGPDAALARVLRIARSDPRVRAAVLSGSLADPSAPRDALQDVDVVFVVDDPASVARDEAFLARFGAPAIVQRPDEMRSAPARDDGGATVLTLFRDDTRVDLTLLPPDALRAFEHDGPSFVLYDPDGVVPSVPSDASLGFAPRPPDARAFAECCNEFWWVAPYVAKGLLRSQVTYAVFHAEAVLRPELLRLLDWHVGERSGWRHGGGKLGRDLGRRLEPELWERLLASYADADRERAWEALSVMTTLFHDVATSLAARLGLPYPHAEAERVRAHLARVRATEHGTRRRA